MNEKRRTVWLAASGLLVLAWGLAAMGLARESSGAPSAGAPSAGAPSAPSAPGPTGPRASSEVRGMTISCQTHGPEWGTDGFGVEVERLTTLGVNWIAIHPYAGIRADGSLRYRPFTKDTAPAYFTRPVREAQARGAKILIKPHLAYWGSPFSWRGEIDFEGEALERFFREYEQWITLLAEVTSDADAFCVGTELDRLLVHDADWRRVIAGVRARTDIPLTYAANWSDYKRVPFWSALDVIGIQAYFPISDRQDPSASDLDDGWKRVLGGIERYAVRQGRPVVFTELGYDASLDTAREPWNPARPERAQRERAEALQALCLERALLAIENESDWLVGCFLWKWFVGRSRSNFRKDTPRMRDVMAARWAEDA